MPNKYSYSHVIADLGRRGVIQSVQDFDGSQEEDPFYSQQSDSEGDAYTIPAQSVRPSNTTQLKRPHAGRLSPSYYTPPSQPSPPPVQYQYANVRNVAPYDRSQEPGQYQYAHQRNLTSPTGHQQPTRRENTEVRESAPREGNQWLAQSQDMEASNFLPEGNQHLARDQYTDEPDFAPSDESQWPAQDQYAGMSSSLPEDGNYQSRHMNVNSHRTRGPIDRTRSSDAESLRSSVASVQTVLYDPNNQPQRSLVDQTGASIYAEEENVSYDSQSSAPVSSWSSEGQGQMQTGRDSNLSPGPSTSTNSDEGPPSHGSHSTQPSLSHSSGSSRPSDSTEPTPLSMHDVQSSLPEQEEQIERKQYTGQATLSTVNEGQISEFSVEPLSQNRPARGKGILKTPRYFDQDQTHNLEREHERQPPARNPLRNNWHARSGSPSDAHVSRVLRSSRLPPRPEEPRDVRRLDGVELAEGTRLATQNTDGTDVPVMEAEEVNDLPPPPEAQEGPGLAARDTGPTLDLQRPMDRLRAASPPPPPNFSRNEVRKIAPRAGNQGRSLTQEHFTGTSRNPVTSIKDHIDAISQEFQQKFHGRPRNQEEKPFDIIPEPEVKAPGILPESVVVGPSKDQYWAQPSIWDELEDNDSMSAERQEQLIQVLRGQRPTEHDLPMGEPHVESSDPTERQFGFDEEDLVDSTVFDRNISSLKAEQILGLNPKPPKDAPSKRSTARGFGNVVKKFLPGQHAGDNESRTSTESETAEQSSDTRSNGIVQRMQREDVDQASIASRDTGDALPPPIRR